MKYERYYGKIDLDGKDYDYVMRKVINDTVYLLCLPNHTRSELNKTKAAYASGSADNNSSSKKGIESLIKKQAPITEYFQHNNGLNLKYASGSTSKKEDVIFSPALAKGNFNLPFQPPDNNS